MVNEETIEKGKELDIFFTSSLDMLCIARTNGVFVRLNPEWEKVLGYTIEELQGSIFWDYVHPDDREATLQVMKELESQKEITSFINRYRCKDGAYRWIEWRSKPMEGMIYAVARDITERINKDLTIKEQNERQRILLNASNKLINTDSEKLDGIMGDILSEIGKLSVADRVYVFENDDQREVTKNIYEWCDEGITPQIDQMQDISYSVIEQWLDRHRKGESIVIHDLKALPKGDSERKILEPQGIKSILTVPMFSEGKLFGFVGFDAVKAHHFYTEEEQTMLRQFANNLMMTIKKKRETSKLRMTEQELRSSNNLLDSMFHSIQDGISILNTDLTIRQVNRKMAALYGEEETIAGKYCYEVYRNRKTPCDDCPTIRAIETKKTGTEVKPMVINGKQKGWLEVFAYPMIEPSTGKVEGVVEFLRDITKRKTMEEELLVKSHVLDQIQDTVTVTDLDGIIKYVNLAERKALGHPTEELVGRSIEVFGENETQGTTQEEILKETLRHGIWRGEVVNKAVDGRRIIYDVRTQVIKDHQGEIIALAGVSTDITERKKMEEELKVAKAHAESANKAKSEFLANMSHEIRTPLNGVVGFTELLQDTPLSFEQKQYLENIHVSGNMLLNIINDILDFSKIEAGKLELEKIKVDMYELLDNTIDIIKYQAEKKDFELLLNCDPDMPRFALTDPIRLKQVLTNLLSNAIKFTDEGEVELRVRYEKKGDKNGKFTFAIRDTGIGMTEEEMNKLFKAFYQADTSTTRKYGGTGLGLVISKLITRELGSKITVDSQEGKGSTFSFDLITDIEYGDSSNNPSIESVKNCLIIDDHERNRRILKEMLSKWDIHCETSESGFQALNILENSPSFDVILCDYNMPYIDGIETITMIRQKLGFKGPVILLYSSSVEDAFHQKCEALDIRFKLGKPVKSRDLFSYLSRLHDPCLEDKESLTAKPHSKQESVHGEYTILVAEDLPMNMFMIKSLIGKIAPGANIYEAKNGLEAMAIYRENHPDLIFMDVQMPVCDGIEATEKIRLLEKEKNSHAPIVALTAGASSINKERCLAAGMDDFLTKPIESEKIRTIFENQLKNNHQNQEIEHHDKEVNLDKAHFSKETFVERVGSEELAKELVEVALVDIPPRMKWLKDAIKAGDHKKIRDFAHLLKGAGLSLAFPHFTKIALSIQELSEEDHEEHPSLLQKEYNELELEWEIIKRVLEDLKSGP